MEKLSVSQPSGAPNVGANAGQAAGVVRPGHANNNRRAQVGKPALGLIQAHAKETPAATPISGRNASTVPDDPSLTPISWFTDFLERMPGSANLSGKHQGHFQLIYGSESLVNDTKNLVNFAQEIDQNILRASELLEKSERNPLNEKEQQEVNSLLNAGKYNLSQVQGWASKTRHEWGVKGHTEIPEFMLKLQERLADRHMDLADLMCMYDIDQVPPEQAVNRADRIDHNLVAADAALKVVGGLAVIGLSGEAKQQMVEVLESHCAELGQAKDIALGKTADPISAQVLSKEVWDFSLTKGKEADSVLPRLRKHWDTQVAGTTGGWLPLAHPKLTQTQMLQEFVKHQLKEAGVAEKNMPDLKFQFNKATTRVRNERPWEPIEKELHYFVGSESRKVHSKITPAKAMSRGFAKDFPANGVCCSDRLQYTHVPNLAHTELTDESGKTLFSALRHGVLDAYDITASNLRKLPDQELRTMVRDLLPPRNLKNDGAPPLPPRFEDGLGRAVASSSADATIQKTDNNHIAYLGQFSDTCPEECAIFLANHFNLECQFETYKHTGQIDISVPLSRNLPEPDVDRPMLFTDGKSEALSFNYIQDLDKNSVHFMRTGQNNGAGHNQILYSKDNEWYAHDSTTRPPEQLTSSGSLTDLGIGRLVKKYATWGVANGETSISTMPVTKESASALIDFIKDCRNEGEGIKEGEDVAIENLYGSAVQPRSNADIDLDAQRQQQIASESPYADIDDEAIAIQMQKIASESPYVDMDDLDDVSVDSVGNAADADPAVVLASGDSIYGTVRSRADWIIDAIRTNPTQAAKYASEMRTAASQNMAKELAVAALVSDPNKLQAALDGDVVNLTLSSISLLTPDRIRSVFSPKSNERAMLRRQTEALKNLEGAALSLEVRDAKGELRTVEVNCKVRTFNFGVNAGAVGKAKHIPSHTLGWDKLMGWGYAMERNNPELRTLLGDPRSAKLGGEVQDKLTELEDKNKKLRPLLDVRNETAAIVPPNREFEAETRELEMEIATTTQHIITLTEAAEATKTFWRDGSYKRGGQDPYKMVSRLGVVINKMGESLAFNCKSGKDRTGQLDAELKFRTTLDATDHRPNMNIPTPLQLRQMRSDFTLNTGNLEMQRMNTGLPGFKLDSKTVPGLANYIAGPEMESLYRGGSAYINS